MRKLIVFTAVLAFALSGSIAMADFETGDGSTDTTAGNVGIWTTNPLAPLQIAETTGYIKLGGTPTSNGWGGIFMVNSNSLKNWYAAHNYNIAGAFEIGRSTIVGGNSFSTPDFLISQEGNVYLKGNVGIGTTNPLRQLQIGNTAGYINLGGAPTANGSGGIFMLNSSILKNWFIGHNQAIAGAFEIGRTTAAGGSTYATPDFLISSTGNVGIGTNYPAVKLDVAGDIKASGTITGPSISALQTSITQIQTLLGSLANPTVSTVLNQNASDIQANLAAIQANDADILELQGDLSDLSDDLVDAKADLQAQIDALVAANADLRADTEAAIAENAGLIADNTAAIAQNLSYIKYIETALSAPGASGISKYERQTTP